MFVCALVINNFCLSGFLFLKKMLKWKKAPTNENAMRILILERCQTFFCHFLSLFLPLFIYKSFLNLSRFFFCFSHLFRMFLSISFSVVSYFFSFFPSLFQYLSFYSNVSFFLSLFLFLCHFFRFFLSDSRPWRVGSLTSMSPFQKKIKKYHFWKWSNLWN